MASLASPQAVTPRPTPLYMDARQTFSTKKERGVTPRDWRPPQPPIKSAPPVSRIFPPRKRLLTAAPVFFRTPEKSILNDPLYNASSKDLYFEQCFDIISRLGYGSFGEVYKVRSKEDGRLYAVKRSRTKFRGVWDRQKRLEEVDKHEMLSSHPNCVGFVRAWEEKDYLYIQTELCKMSLNKLADYNHNLPESLIWNYLVDLLMAVKHLHDLDFVHMDIKPENIFISFTNICKLGDFGLVINLKKPVEISDAMEGDPKYLAPELMLGKFGKPADIFSVGITILELASDLDLPKGGELWHQLRSGQLPEEFLKGISDELKDVMTRMLEPDPALRATVDQVLAHEHIVRVVVERKGAWLSEGAGPDDELSKLLQGPPEEGSPIKPGELNKSTDEEETFLSLGSPFSSPVVGRLLYDGLSDEDDDESGAACRPLPVARLFHKSATTPGVPRHSSRLFDADPLSPDRTLPILNFDDEWDISPTSAAPACLPGPPSPHLSPHSSPVASLAELMACAPTSPHVRSAASTAVTLRSRTKSCLKGRNSKSCERCVPSARKVRFNPVERKNLLKGCAQAKSLEADHSAFNDLACAQPWAGHCLHHQNANEAMQKCE